MLRKYLEGQTFSAVHHWLKNKRGMTALMENGSHFPIKKARARPG